MFVGCRLGSQSIFIHATGWLPLGLAQEKQDKKTNHDFEVYCPLSMETKRKSLSRGIFSYFSTLQHDPKKDQNEKKLMYPFDFLVVIVRMRLIVMLA